MKCRPVHCVGASSRRESSTVAGDLIEDEIAATNRVKLEVYLYYARYPLYLDKFFGFLSCDCLI